MNREEPKVAVNRAQKDTMFRFLYDDKEKLLELYKHQSTYNPNMPLRDLFYVSNEYQKLIGDKKSLYASRFQKKIPCWSYKCWC